ncbi:MAG: zinc ribbon domain-containing protein [Candidatus Methanosuratincola petrocarbonis]|nr:zinc ribbon domain-containing protein [Candidatus Methanosuratincola sp.]
MRHKIRITALNIHHIKSSDLGGGLWLSCSHREDRLNYGFRAFWSPLRAAPQLQQYLHLFSPGLPHSLQNRRGYGLLPPSKQTRPNCKAEIHKNFKFCPNCGTPIKKPEQPVCPKCGEKNPSGTKFCGNCGEKLA